MRSVVLFVLIALVPAAAGEPGPRVRTLAIVPGRVVHFAQDGPWLAWATECDSVAVTLFRPGRRARRFPCNYETGSESDLALAGRRALWFTTEGAHFTYYWLHTATPFDRRWAWVDDFQRDNADGAGTGMGGLAADGQTLVYSTIEFGADLRTCNADGYFCTTTTEGGALYRVVPGRSIAFGERPARSCSPLRAVAWHSSRYPRGPSMSRGSRRGVRSRCVTSARVRW